MECICPLESSMECTVNLASSVFHGVQGTKDEAVMFLLQVSTFLSSLLIVLHLVSFLLTKLFTFLLDRATTYEEQKRDSLLITEDEIKRVTHEICSEDGELAAGIFGREGPPLFYHESVVNDTLLVHEAKDFNQQHLLEVDESFAAEFPYGSPPFNTEKLGIDRYGDAPVTDVIRPSDSPSPIVCELVEDEDIGGDACHSNVLEEAEEEAEVLSKNETLFVIGQTHSDSNKFRLEEDGGTFDGSLAGESTSNGSTTWRSSAINRASETECLPSSSSRRSSSNWETLPLFQKYDEEMTFLDRISSQKLAETESVRSIRFQPRSISERIARKFTIQKKKGGNRDPYQELEIAYVAQISLTWEALNWNYVRFQQRKANGDGERFYCTARIAQQFQQFQVLLQRFIENEPYQRGRRPQVFARTRISSPRLLQVPEFQEADEDGENIISPTEFSSILEDAIRTFMNFLKADKKNPRQILKSFVKTTSSSVDPEVLRSLKRTNQKMKMGLKGLLRRRRCWNKKWVQGEEEEMGILMGLIDMKIVSRTLRMSEISQEQLQWCEEKMTKVGVLEWKSSKRVLPATFFPLH